jgi:hypothetical protein
MQRVIKTETTDDVLRPGSQVILRKVSACAHRPYRKIGLCIWVKSVEEFGRHWNQACRRKSGSLSKPADGISGTAARSYIRRIGSVSEGAKPQPEKRFRLRQLENRLA